MNLKEAAELIPVIQAFLEGKTIERKTRSWEFNKGWRDATQWEETEELKFRGTFVYRIKPEPKPEPKPSYRPFANAEECWQEMQKHQPFGWTKLIGENGYSFIGDVDDEIIYSDAFKEYTFADGTPFGIKEEENE